MDPIAIALLLVIKEVRSWKVLESRRSYFSSTGNMLDYDDVLEEVGEFGHWQIWLFALLWIPSAVSAMQVSGDFLVSGLYYM